MPPTTASRIVPFNSDRLDDWSEEALSLGGSAMHLVPRSVALSLTDGGVRDPGPRSLWPVDEDYWLGHCEGFQVDGPGGWVGVVEHVVYESRVDRPDVVAVSSGVWRVHTTEVPVADVIEVLPAQERLVVRGELGAAAPVRRWGRVQRVLGSRLRL